MQIHELPSGTPETEDMIPFDTGESNYKTPFSGFDVGENTATFTSADEADPSIFKTVDPIETGPIKTILNRLSMAVSNIRYIWKVLSILVNKMSNYDYYGDTSQSYRISSGDDYFYMNHTEGYFDIKMNNGTHRLLIHQGNASNHEAGQLRVGNLWFIADATDQVMAMRFSGTKYISISGGSNPSATLRCDDSYVEMKPDESFLTVRNNGSQYITFNDNQSRLNIVYGSESIALDTSTHRMSIVASGGVVINGTLTASGSFTTADNKTVTVKNGMITAIS